MCRIFDEDPFDWYSLMPDAWLFCLGGAFILVTLLMPDGIVGLLRRTRKSHPTLNATEGQPA